MSPYRLAAVIGHPIGHSKSPILHRHWLRQHGIKGDYTALDIAPSDLKTALPLLPKLGFSGVNVTIPHKTAVLDLADEITPTAARIGAANTLTFQNGQIHADNTDAYGFLTNLRTQAPNWTADRPAFVIGAGGAARAVIDGLIEAGVPEIRLTNRTTSKADILAADFPRTVVNADPSDCGLIVNTTSLGMTGHPPLPFDSFDPSTTVADLVYSPLETPLLRDAKAHGCVTVDGLGMLLHQAVPAFHRWFGVRPTVTDTLKQEVLA